MKVKMKAKPMTKAAKIDKILRHYGGTHQLFKAAEELSELQMLILQDANEIGKVDTESIIEEMADVQIMLTQIALIYHIDPCKIADVIEEKLDRTIEEINERR